MDNTKPPRPRLNLIGRARPDQADLRPHARGLGL